jgi:hypothetical protein
MAFAVMAIIVVGTLGAADLLHRSHSRPTAGKTRGTSRLQHRPEPTRAQRQVHPEAPSRTNADVVNALMPLASSLSFAWHPKTSTEANPNMDHEDPPHGRAA